MSWQVRHCWRRTWSLPSAARARQLQPPVRSLQTRLVDADISGVEAIPFNLFQDIVNIPANELNAFNEFGVSLMDGGTWLTCERHEPLG